MAKLQVTVKVVTEKARLVQLKNGGEIWVPESVIISSVLKPLSFGKSEGTLVVQDWWAENNDL